MFPGIRSNSSAVSCTGPVATPFVIAFATTVTTAVALFVRAPKSQSNTPSKYEAVPKVLVAERKETFSGNRAASSAKLAV